jgi:superfamily II RNA helicase
VDLPEDLSPDDVQAILESVPVHGLQELTLDESWAEKDAEPVAAARERMRSLPCEDCPHKSLCHKGNRGKMRLLLREVHALVHQLDTVRGGLWLSFKRHLRFLKENGFVDEGHQLTPDGYWASKLRLDQPLLISEAIRRGSLDDQHPDVLAGSLAPFVWDKPQEVLLQVGGATSLDPMEDAFDRVV